MKLLLLAASTVFNMFSNIKKAFSAKTRVTLKTLTMILTICNTPPSIDHLQLRNVLVGNGSVKSLIDQCSNGKINFEPVIFPSYVNIPCPESVMYCNTDSWAYRADNAILPYFPTLNEYTYKLYILPKGGCSFAGLGQVGPCNKNVTCSVFISGDYVGFPATYFHELGHNLGLDHASYQGDFYGDYSDIMGYCCKKRCFNAPNLHKLAIKSPLHDFSLPLEFKELEQTFVFKANDYIVIREPSATPSVKWYIQWRVPVDEEIPVSFAPSLNIYYTYSDSVLYKKTFLQAILRNKGDIWSGSGFTITLVFTSALEIGIEIRIS